jgi:bifunctional DNase/RNase
MVEGAVRKGKESRMLTTTETGFIEMRIAKVVAFGPPLAEEDFECVVLDEVSGDRHLVISIGASEAFWLAAHLQGVPFGRPMTYQFTAALVESLGGQVRAVRIDRLIDGAYGATVTVDGPAGTQYVDARASDALNLAALSSAAISVSAEVLDHGHRQQEGESATASLLRLAPTVPAMRISRELPPEPKPRLTKAPAPDLRIATLR